MLRSPPVPVAVLTGHLGAGKTTLLNVLLRRPGARVGVIVNDFGAVNVDAGLISGQVDEPASIAGGCICCLPDAGGLDEALAKLTHPRLALDVVMVEASGLAEPATLARLIENSAVDRVRPGGVIEVVDALEYFGTLDDGVGLAPLRFDAATLVVVNKVDAVPAQERARRLHRITERVRQRNPRVQVVPAQHGRIDPALIYDPASTEDPPDQLPFAASAREEALREHHTEHLHADAVTVVVPGPIEPGDLLDLLADPPATAYRIKGIVTVAEGPRLRSLVVNVVGRSSRVDRLRAGNWGHSELVAIGLHLEAAEVRRRLESALRPAREPSAEGLRALTRMVRG